MLTIVILAASMAMVGVSWFTRAATPPSATCPSCGQWDSHKMWCPYR
jgi:hypothetical protein